MRTNATCRCGAVFSREAAWRAWWCESIRRGVFRGIAIPTRARRARSPMRLRRDCDRRQADQLLRGATATSGTAAGPELFPIVPQGLHPERTRPAILHRMTRDRDLRTELQIGWTHAVAQQRAGTFRFKPPRRD